jgi:methyl coenzyme M reductase subunit C-like uncharacterized protein (methanogenesis marker protein 7)
MLALFSVNPLYVVLVNVIILNPTLLSTILLNVFLLNVGVLGRQSHRFRKFETNNSLKEEVKVRARNDYDSFSKT